MLSETQKKLITQYWNNGLGDVAIAEKVGSTRSAVEWFRKRHNMPSNFFPKVDHWKAIALYQEKLSDRQIADRMGVHPSNIWQWRKGHELPPNITQGFNSRELEEKSKAKREEPKPEAPEGKKKQSPKDLEALIRKQIVHVESQIKSEHDAYAIGYKQGLVYALDLVRAEKRKKGRASDGKP